MAFLPGIFGKQQPAAPAPAPVTPAAAAGGGAGPATWELIPAQC